MQAARLAAVGEAYKANEAASERDLAMMNGMMNGAMMWGMGLFWILVIIVLVLAAAVLLLARTLRRLARAGAG